MRVRIVLLSFALAATSQSADEKQSKLRLATAPSEEYALEWTQPRGPLRVVSAKDSSVSTELDVAALFKTSAEETTSMPLPFISPDSSWVFVVGPSSDVFPGPFDRPSVLFHRTQSKDGEIRFEAPVAGRFDKAAWEFLDHEFKLKRTDLPPDAQWVYSADFIDWSRDSARLLVRVTGGAWSESKNDWVQPAAYSWYCYFNTRSGKFELTDRLRFADTRPERNEFTADENASLIAVVTNAESIGEEGPQRSPKERFDQADKRLNDVYGKLISQTEPAKRETLREEQRGWLVSLDTDAKVAAIQAWSFGREADARILESKATATEARVAELEKRATAESLASDSANFTGSWGTPHSDVSAFSLDLTQTGNRIEGYHTAIAQSGKRIDAVLPKEGPPSITGTISDGVAHVRFRSGYDESAPAQGEATLTLRGDKLEWKITNSSGIHYFPNSSVLYRQKSPTTGGRNTNEILGNHR